MKIRLLTYMALPFIFIGTTVQAGAPNNLWDAAETVQSALIDELNDQAAAFTGQNAQRTFETLVLNGTAGVKEVVNLDQLNGLFFGNFNFDANSLTSSLGSITGSAMNTDILGDISANDVMNFDVDAYLSMKQGQVMTLTEAQIRNLLGKGISDKLSGDQIKSLAKNPSQLTGMLDGLANANKQQRQASNGLVGMGIKKDRTGGTGRSSGGSADVGTTSVLGPDGNRSDAFQGTGNGSVAQFAAAQKQFEGVRENIEANAQLPRTQEELSEITLDQLEKIQLFQTEMNKEMATQGLSKAWIRQEVAKKRQPKREEAAVKLINDGATDIRGAISVVSLLSIMSVESQNYATDVYSTNLATYGAHLNQRIGTQFNQSIAGNTSTGSQATDGSTQK